MSCNQKMTSQVQARYERIAPIYDLMEAFAERRYRPWRSRFWSMVEGPSVLEVGVGTGKNMPFYSDDIDVVGIELTPGMLRRAEKQAVKLGTSMTLGLGDVQNLDFEEASFDNVVATFVFCSVPDPLLGLKELARVVKPDGRLLLLEHVRSEKPAVGLMMDLLNPIVKRVMGANINRHTVQNIEQSGWHLEQVENVGSGDIFKLIVARRN